MRIVTGAGPPALPVGAGSALFAYLRGACRLSCVRVLCSAAYPLRFLSVFSAPELDVEASFEAGDAEHMRPCCAFEDVEHGLWGDVALVGHFT